MTTGRYVIIQNKEQERHPKLKRVENLKWDNKLEDDEDIVSFLEYHFNMDLLCDEFCYIIAFDTQKNSLGVYEVSHGDFKNANMGGREVCMFLLLTGCTSFIVAHNHPSNTLKASIEDYVVTAKLQELSHLLGINFLQHYIICDGGYKCIIEEELLDEDTNEPMFKNLKNIDIQM